MSLARPMYVRCDNARQRIATALCARMRDTIGELDHEFASAQLEEEVRGSSERDDKNR